MVRDNHYFSPPERWFRALTRTCKQKYIAVSEQNRDLIAQMFHMPAKSIEVVPNGADPAVFACTADERAAGRAKLREELGLPPETRLLLTVGRLSNQKGHDLLVPVMAHVIERHPDVRFIWAGEGPNEKDLKALLEQYGVEKFTTLLGRRGDIPHLLNSSDLFVHPTRFEGQPFSMLEAMAAGLPIVTTQASGITEVLEDRVHGLLGRVEDVRDLRENLFFALDHPDDMRAMAERARLRLEAFTEAKMIERTLTLLTDLCR
jgi:glycosyltransferase involved in cell wall biosynthesis